MNTTTSLMKAARQRMRECGRGGEFVGRIKGYCDNGQCPVRQVEMNVKEYADNVPARLLCPSCQQPLLIDWVETFEEHEGRENKEARESVNVQLYCRDQQGLKIFPVSILCDDSLPTVESVQRLPRLGVMSRADREREGLA